MKILKKYVAYNPSTFKFMGFFNEGRKDLPTTVAEVSRETFLEDKGQHTHYNPEIGSYYTPEEDVIARQIESDKIWRDYELRSSDLFMIEDYPITAQEKVEIKQYRQALRDFPQTRVKPTKPQKVIDVLG